jgi:hypothetical protein
LKLRLKVRTLALPVGGAWPMPTHGPQAGSRMRRPARSRSSSTPEVVMVVRIWRLPGEMVPTVVGGRCLPASMAAGMARSSYQEFTLEPKQTWNTGVPATSLDRDHVVGLVRPGDQRLQAAQVDVHLLVVLGVVVGAELDPLVLALLAGQEPAGLGVGGEDGGGPAELGDHVADGGPLGDGQARPRRGR